MRIDAYNAVSQIYQAGTVSSVKSTDTTKALSDKFEISQTAKSYQTAKTAVSASSDVREDKVALIKSQLAAGTYHVSSQDVADKMLSTVDTLTF